MTVERCHSAWSDNVIEPEGESVKEENIGSFFDQRVVYEARRAPFLSS